MSETREAEMFDDRPGAWGYPRTNLTTWLQPAPGDIILDEIDGGWFTAESDQGHHFVLEDGCQGHVTMTGTCDGLIRSLEGLERDGYRLEVVCELPPRKTRRVWRLVRGRPEEL